MSSLTVVSILILAILGLAWFWTRSTRNRQTVYGQVPEGAHATEPQPPVATQTAGTEQKPQHKHGCC